MSSRFLVLLLVFSFGCSVGPSYVPPCIEVPCAWKNEQEERCEGVAVIPEYYDYWWEVFEDEKLNGLEQWALVNNRDLYSSYERIEEARALMGVAKADLFPQITLNPLYTNTGELIKNYNSLPAIINSAVPKVFRAHELLYFLPLNLNYEVDLWGKIRDRYNNAKYTWCAEKEDYNALMLSLTANLATAYYQLRAADLQSDYLLKTLETREKALQINKDRYEAEITFYADVTLAAQEVETVLGQYYEVQRQRDVLEDLIATLIGIPASEFCIEHHPLTGMPPCIPEGIPIDVLLRRPDIAEAEYLTRAQNFAVKEAYSEFFPSLTLTGTLGFESPIFGKFLQWISRYWMYGEQINQVVFDGWRTCNNVSYESARFKELSGAYQQQVLTAFQEVEDSLISLQSYADQYQAALMNTQYSEKTYNLYKDRYTSGIIYYINVVDTERDLLNAQIYLSEVLGYRYLATIQLIKSLGGGW